MAKNRKKQRLEALARAANAGEAPVSVVKKHGHNVPVVKVPEPEPVVVVVVPPPPPVEKPKKKRYVRPPRIKAPPERVVAASKGLSFAGRVLGKSVVELKEPPLKEKLTEIGGGR